MTLPNGSLATVLLADHDPQESQVVRPLLEREKYQVQFAENGDTVLSVMQSQTPDIVLLRTDLPGKSGLDLCRELKADNRFSLLPLVLLTGTSQAEITAAFDAGADDV